MMDYKEVSIDCGGTRHHPVAQCNNILIDGKYWAYDIEKDDNYTVLHNRFWEHKDGKRFQINCILELNSNNPKETIDKFFKLLMLQ